MRLTDTRRLIRDNHIYDVVRHIAKHTTQITHMTVSRSVEIHVFPRYLGDEAMHVLNQIADYRKELT